jgi:rhomboid protease GluP
MAVTQVIFGINVAVFVAMSLAVGVTVLGSREWLALSVRLGANYGPYTVGGQWWRLLACVFIHGGLLHIAFNMWCLWNLGRLAESVYGHWTFAAVYLITGLSSSLMSVAWHSSHPVPSVGASGAIFGIAGALIASFYLGEFSMPRAAMTGMLRSVVTFVAYNLVFGAVVASTDNAAHIGGLLMGLLLGALIAKVAPGSDDFLRRIAVLLIGILLLIGAGMWLRRSDAYIVHVQRGVDVLGQGNADAAIAQLQKSIRQRPDFAPAHKQLALAYVAKHDLANAAAEMQRVIALDPRDEASYNLLGQIYLEQELPEKAGGAFSQALKVNPNSADGHAGLADALANQHRYAEAFEEYKKAAAIDPAYPDIYFKMGEIEERLKLYDDAIASLLKQRQTADDDDNENLLAELYDAKGMKAEADAARQKAAQLQGSH